MRSLVFVLISSLLLLFSSCSVIHKTKQMHSVQFDTAMVSKVDHRAVLVEKVDTTVYTHADTVTNVHTAPMGIVLADSLSTATQKISVVIANGTLHLQAIAKAQPVSLTIDKKETTNDNTDIATKGSIKLQDKSLIKTVTRPAYVLWISIFIILLIVGLTIYIIKTHKLP